MVTRLTKDSITLVGREDIVSDTAPRKTVAKATVTCAIRDGRRQEMLFSHLAPGMRAHATCFDSEGSGNWDLVRARPATGMRFATSGILTAIGFNMDTAVPDVEVTNGDDYPVTCDASDAAVAGLVVGTRVRMTCTFDGTWRMTTVKPLGGGVTTRTIRAKVLDFADGNLLLFALHAQTNMTHAYTIAVPLELVATASALTYGTNVVAVEKADGPRWLLVSLQRA